MTSPRGPLPMPRLPETRKPRYYHCGEADYIFRREDGDGGDRMICEVRGAGSGLYDANVHLLLEALNDHEEVQNKLSPLMGLSKDVVRAAAELLGSLETHKDAPCRQCDNSRDRLHRACVELLVYEYAHSSGLPTSEEPAPWYKKFFK